MWKRLWASWKVERTCAEQYTKIDFAGLHISYDHMWWFNEKRSVEGRKAIDQMADAIVKRVLEEMKNEQQHTLR